MSGYVNKDDIINEIELIPENRLAEIYDLIHYFRIGLEISEEKTQSIMEFAGCWRDMPDDLFESFAGEITER